VFAQELLLLIKLKFSTGKCLKVHSFHILLQLLSRGPQISYRDFASGPHWGRPMAPPVRSHHTSTVSLHYLVKCQSLKSDNWKKDDFCNNTF